MQAATGLQQRQIPSDMKRKEVGLAALIIINIIWTSVTGLDTQQPTKHKIRTNILWSSSSRSDWRPRGDIYRPHQPQKAARRISTQRPTGGSTQCLPPADDGLQEQISIQRGNDAEAAEQITDVITGRTLTAYVTRSFSQGSPTTLMLAANTVSKQHTSADQYNNCQSMHPPLIVLSEFARYSAWIVGLALIGNNAVSFKENATIATNSCVETNKMQILEKSNRKNVL